MPGLNTYEAKPLSPMFFFSTPDSKEPSPYFYSLELARIFCAVNGIEDVTFWTGTHEAPIPVNEQGVA